MNRVKPYKGRSTHRLADLIKEANPKLKRENISFEFGSPVPVVGWLNTELMVRPIVLDTPNTCGCETVPALFEKIRYRRLDLNVLNLLPACEIKPVENVSVPFNIHAILPQINEALGLDLTADEVVDRRYENAATHYKLEIRGDHNLAWAPSFYMFETTLTYDTNTRLLEDGTVRDVEDGKPRVSEIVG